MKEKLMKSSIASLLIASAIFTYNTDTVIEADETDAVSNTEESTEASAESVSTEENAEAATEEAAEQELLVESSPESAPEREVQQQAISEYNTREETDETPPVHESQTAEPASEESGNLEPVPEPTLEETSEAPAEEPTEEPTQEETVQEPTTEAPMETAEPSTEASSEPVEESTPEATLEQPTEEATVETTESSMEEATIQESTSEATVETAEPSIEAPSEEEPTTEPQTEPAQEDTLQQSTEEATVQESTSEASVEADGTKEEVTGESTQPSDGNPAGEDVEDGREAAVPEISSEEGQPREPEVAQPADDRSGSVQKYYRYDHGNILEGISLNPGTSEEQLNLLDKRVNRLMSSKIMPQEDVDESDIIEIEEEIKNEEGVTASTDRTSLPDTGETDYTILYGTTLLIAGAILLFITRRLNSKKCKSL
ncbi:hypothetical protein ACBR55_09825 [Salinicoccus roseus]|uniref:hypothetical protein n=1 Tax=Salinicoccus roseus TaxID=45670 RepID=UPI003524977D